MEAAAERGWVLGAEDLGVSIVIEEAESLAPRDEHRELGAEQESNHGAQ